MLLDPFAKRQWEPTASLRITHDQADFTARVNEFYDANPDALKDGYAPFCKHLFIPNFTDCKSGTLQITPENEQYLRSGYDARKENELPVLVRWFDGSKLAEQPVAKFLDIILYSKEQITKETQSMGEPDVHGEMDYDYGIISVKPQDVDHELPMQPITVMRNGLGKEYGGSGVAIEEAKYRESVAYWKDHALIK